MKYKAVYVGKEDKRIEGSFHGLSKAYRTSDGFVFEFTAEKYAHKASKVLRESGYINVRVM